MHFHLSGLVSLPLVALFIGGCGSGTRPDRVLVRVDGRVVRGPIQPVCQVDISCDAPFSAGFSVRQGGDTVAHFQSDTDGRFTVRLEPGVYLVVPDADAPIFSPRQQTKPLTIPDADSTTVELSFDTGIR